MYIKIQIQRNGKKIDISSKNVAFQASQTERLMQQIQGLMAALNKLCLKSY